MSHDGGNEKGSEPANFDTFLRFALICFLFFSNHHQSGRNVTLFFKSVIQICFCYGVLFPANCFYTLQPVFIVRDLEEEKKKEMKGNQLYKMATSPLGRLFWLETKGYFRKII